MYETAKETLMYRTILWTLWERERVGRFGRMALKHTPMAENEEELKSLLMKVKVESEKVGLKLKIQKTKIMASGPITSWEIDGETVRDLIWDSLMAQMVKSLPAMWETQV